MHIDCISFHESEVSKNIPLKLNTASFKNAIKKLGITKDEALVIRDRWSKYGGTSNFQHLVIKKTDLPSKFHTSIRAKEGKCYVYLQSKVDALPLDYLYVEVDGNKNTKLSKAFAKFCLNHC